MMVIAPKGQTCPREGTPRKYITDGEAVDVPESAYYLRLIDDGSLVRAAGKDQDKAAPEESPSPQPSPLKGEGDKV